MANETSSKNGLYLIVGILLAAVIGFILYNQGVIGDQKADIEIDLPDAEVN